MVTSDKLLACLCQAQQHGTVLKAMDVSIDEKELPMAILNGMPPQFENIITTPSTLGNDSTSFNLNTVENFHLRKKRRRDMRVKKHFQPVLFLLCQPRAFTTKPYFCSHCKPSSHVSVSGSSP